MASEEHLPAIKAELAGVHPTTLLPYDADNEIAANQLNAPNRPAETSVGSLIDFLLMKETHSTDGQDTQARPLWQRMEEVEALDNIPNEGVPNPWGSSAIGNINEIGQIKVHTLLDFIRLTAGGNLPINFQDSNFQSYVTGAMNAGCMSEDQKDALLALGNNKQSRVQEEAWGNVGAGTVKRARALP